MLTSAGESFVIAFAAGWLKNAKKIENIGMVSEMYHPMCTATSHEQRVTRNQQYLQCPKNKKSVFFGDMLRRRACCLGKQVLPHEKEVHCYDRNIPDLFNCVQFIFRLKTGCDWHVSDCHESDRDTASFIMAPRSNQRILLGFKLFEYYHVHPTLFTIRGSEQTYSP
jgi:hypothetical protein